MDENFKDTTLNFYFQIIEKIRDRKMLDLFQHSFMSQFASYIHKNIGNDESKNYCISRLSLLPNMYQLSVKIKEMIQDSFTDTYSWSLSELNKKNNSINSFKVTSFDSSKWPKEYLIGNNNNKNSEKKKEANKTHEYFTDKNISTTSVIKIDHVPETNNHVPNTFEHVTTINLPTTLAMAFENYKNYISQNYTNMNIKLLPHFGTGELLYRIPNSDLKVTIIATTFEIILLETIENEELSFEDIKNHTNLNLSDLMYTIKSLLIKPKNCTNAILLRKIFKPEVSSNIHKNDLFKVNPNFKPNTKTVDLTK